MPTSDLIDLCLGTSPVFQAATIWIYILRTSDLLHGDISVESGWRVRMSLLYFVDQFQKLEADPAEVSWLVGGV